MDDDANLAAQAATTTSAVGALTGSPAPAPLDPDRVDELKPATETAASGALIEPTIVERVPTGHPAIDDNPRALQSVAANRLDMNDPSVPGHVQVARNLGLPDDYDQPKKD